MRLMINTPDGVEECEFVHGEPDLAVVAERDTETGDIYEGVRLLEDVALDATRVCREFELGSIRGISEDWLPVERQCFGKKPLRVCLNVPVHYRRISTIKLFASVCVSVSTPEDEWKILRQCALASLDLSIPVAIQTPMAVVPSFKARMITCLMARGQEALANSLEVGLFNRKTPDGPWKRAP